MTEPASDGASTESRNGPISPGDGDEMNGPGAFDAARDLGACALILCVTLGVFWPLTGFGFVSFDDGTHVFDNVHVIGGLDPASLAWSLAPQSGHWHPLTWISLTLDSELFGLEPRAFHATALGLHGLAACALYLAFACATGRRAASAAVALAFAVHPLHVEPVAWISSRKDVLSGLFFAATLLAYVGWVRRERPLRFVLVAAALALGLMSKAMLVTTPFVLLLLDLWPLRRIDPDDLVRSVADRVREKALLFGMAIGTVAMAIYAAESHGMVRGAPLLSRAATVLSNYGFYLTRTIWPVDLSVTYPTGAMAYGTAMLIAMGALLTTVTFTVVRVWREAPWWTVGWLWFAGMLVPVIGLVPLAGHDVADRYAYLPITGLFVAAAFGLDALIRSRPSTTWGVRAGVVLLLATLAFVSARQVEHWASTEALFAHAIEAVPNNWIAHRALAGHLAGEGEIDLAITEYEAVLSINPHDWHSMANLGGLHARAQRHDRAIEDYTQSMEMGARRIEALGANPRARAALAPLHYQLAVSLMAEGRRYEADRAYAEAVRLDPRFGAKPSLSRRR